VGELAVSKCEFVARAVTQQLRHAAFQTRPPTTLQPRPICATHFPLPANHALRNHCSFTLFCIGPQVRPLFPHHLHLLGQAIRISTRKSSMLADQIETHTRCRYGTYHDSKYIRCVGRYVSFVEETMGLQVSLQLLCNHHHQRQTPRSLMQVRQAKSRNSDAQHSSRSTTCVSEFEDPQRILFSMSDERVLQMAGRYTIIRDLFLSLNCILESSKQCRGTYNGRRYWIAMRDFLDFVPRHRVRASRINQPIRPRSE
jgi:hypothetical protein